MKLETKILIYQYFIAIVAIILIVINIVGVYAHNFYFYENHN